MTACWLWDGGYFPGGYGRAWSVRMQRPTQAHRLVYEELVGPIPPKMQLDHLCRRRGCVNPEHLMVVTCRENLYAPGSLSPTKRNGLKTHCVRGHAFDPLNTHTYKGSRRCRTCLRLYMNRYYHATKTSAHGAIPSRAAGCSSGTGEVVIAGISSLVTTPHVGPPVPGKQQVIEEQVHGEYVDHAELGTQRSR